MTERAVVSHCCREMATHLDGGNVAIVFNEKFREYGIWYEDKGSFQLLHFCPWCGSRLPGSLRETWFDQIEALGLGPDDCELPAAYLSAEWWLLERK